MPGDMPVMLAMGACGICAICAICGICGICGCPSLATGSTGARRDAAAAPLYTGTAVEDAGTPETPGTPGTPGAGKAGPPGAPGPGRAARRAAWLGGRGPPRSNGRRGTTWKLGRGRLKCHGRIGRMGHLICPVGESKHGVVVAMTLCLQTGHDWLKDSHLSMHDTWYACKQGRQRKQSPVVNSSMQMVHLPCGSWWTSSSFDCADAEPFWKV